MSGPTQQRTCIGCREVSSKSSLVRLYKDPEGGVSFDPEGRGEGRGAYLCMKVDCVALAIKKSAFSRAFRTAVQYKDPRDIGRGLRDALCRCAQKAQQDRQDRVTRSDAVTNWLRFADELEKNLQTLSGKKPGKAPKETEGKTAP